jgi:hypothetical protein
VELCPSPTLQWSMPHFSHCWMPSSLQAHWGKWCHTCLLWPACLFKVCLRDCPFPTLWSSGCPAFFVTSFFFFFQLLVYYSAFFLFSLGWGQCVQGAMLTCPRVFCGSTTCHLAHLVVCFSHAGKELGSGSAGALLVSLFNME